MKMPRITQVAAGCIVAGAGIALLILLVRTVLFPVLLPMGITYATAAWIRRVTAHTKIGQNGRYAKWARLLLAVLLCVVVIIGGVGLLTTLAKQAQELVTRSAQWDLCALPAWFTDHMPKAWQEIWASRIDTALLALVEKGAAWLGSTAGAVLSSLPGAALTVLFTIASLFYWVDGSITTWLGQWYQEHVPTKWQCRWEACQGVWQRTGAGIAAYLRAQLCIAAVVFVVLSVGLGLLGIEGQVAWAAMITMTDLLPLLGAGVVLAPWAVLLLLIGQTSRGIGLLVLWGLTWLLRQIGEPKLTGHALGVHPYVMLVGLYTGYRMGGIGGMLGAAVLLGGLGTQGK